MDAEIRRLGPGDAHVLDRVAAGVFDEPIDPGRAAAYLAEPTHRMVVAIVDGVVVGQCASVIHRHPDKPAEFYVDEVGVADAWLRRGVARRMMEAAFAWGRELGCASSWLGTEADNVPAIGLYRGFGEEPLPIVMFEYDL